MAYVALSHFLPNDRQKRRKKLQQCTFQDPNEGVPCMSTFRGDENPQRFGWMLTGPSREHTKPTNECEVQPLEKDSESPVDINDFPSNLRNYENTFAFPRFFEPIDFKDAIPFSVCYTYKIINLAVVLGPDDMKAGFSMVTTTEGCEVNHVSRDEGKREPPGPDRPRNTADFDIN
ncbi:hypothetical protein Q1695_002156 [Nippostrongylus brasiliensis]|nr:hypothetical protein Q1695_002156 [Nippostrongylus brasiliensis]